MRFVRTRQIAREHLAWMRAISEGVEPQSAWENYLFLEGEFSDAWSRELLAWVKAAVCDALRDAGRGELCSAIEAVEARRSSRRPTLDDLRGEFPEDFYSEAELLEILAEREAERCRPALLDQETRERISRATTLVDAQISRLGAAPAPTDHVSRWFRTSVAEALVASGLHSLEDIAAASKRSRQWYLAVPGVGATVAAKLMAWLEGCFPAQAEGVAPPALAGQPGAAQQLMRIEVPAESEDEAAVNGWIFVKARRSTETRRYYQKEARKFFIFLRSEYACMTLKQVDMKVCADFFDWLAAIGTDTTNWRWSRDSQYWVCKPSTRLSSPEWRPFVGAQTAPSMKATERALHAMFVYLASTGYVKINPMALLPKMQKVAGSMQFRSRALSSEYVAKLLAWRGTAGRTGARDRAVVVLALSTGLRASEVVRARARQFSLLADGWWLSVTGKGGKVRDIPVEGVVIDELERWSGLEFGVAELDDDFLFTHVNAEGKRRGGEPIGYQSILRGVARVCRDVADDVESSGDIRGARRLRDATTHWLRHSFATGMLDSPAPPPLNAVRQILGHEDLSSTSLYTSLDAAALRKAIARSRE